MSLLQTLIVLMLIAALIQVDAQRLFDVLLARNEELNSLRNERAFHPVNGVLKRNSLLDNLYNIGYMPY
ncbi:unnamed protein product [Caenorhabditis bovis]|uniref:Uncharacterized protein n=1 Tax=Caenorhabditis bovis TaxID=2654633 RepID=A0A8S1F191_9PELO|nr:unnamed protein product [Caenorhabditis bovis]